MLPRRPLALSWLWLSTLSKAPYDLAPHYSFGVTPIELPDREAALLWIEKNQLARRNVTDAYRKTLLQNIAEREARKSRKAQAAEAGKIGGKIAGNGRTKKVGVADQTVREATPDTRSKTRKKMSKELGMSEHALKQAKIVNDAKEMHLRSGT